ncbi:MAG: sulfatase-like hydrolase/transferase [Bacteroidetes bacterium]|nr:sulfatase-like hydrolase/transferase [Bacteroidota bacterium]
MNRSVLLLIFISFIILNGCSGLGSTETDRPNIIFVMTDDHGYQAISAYGSDLIDTPNIDRLANEGMLFRRAYVSNSICAPSRAAILTGKHSHINGHINNGSVFDSTQVTFPKLLQEEGYETAIVGKWHLKSEPTGFDFWKVLPGQGHYYNPDFRTPEGMIQEEGHSTELITDTAIEYLDSIRNQEKPFMLMYQFKAPHRQWWPSGEDIGVYSDRDFEEPESLFDDYENRGTAAKEAEMRIADHMGLTLDNKIHPDSLEKTGMEEFSPGIYPRIYLDAYSRLNDDQKKHWDAYYGPINKEFVENTPEGDELTSWKYQRYMEDYLGVVRSVDRNLGRLLEYLDENGLTDNTMIVYSSDQGFYLGEHGWFDKRFMYEESFRTPLIIRYPTEIRAGSENSDLVQNIDFAPTILDVAGVDVPKEIQGESLTPLFNGNNEDWRDRLYYHYYEYPAEHAVKRHYGIRTNRYKLIHFYYDIDEWELYDLENDPQEMMNLYNDPDYAEIRDSLHQELEDLREHYRDSDELTQQLLERDLAEE